MKVNILARMTVAALLTTHIAHAAEVRVMISAGFFDVYTQMATKFERTTAHRLVTTRGPSTGDSPEAIPTRLARGERADVLILEGGSADELAKKGLVRGDSKVILALAQTGLVVRAGSPVPDIGDPAQFRSALLAARSIACSDSGSGRYFVETILPTLGIADQVMPKLRKVRGPPSGEPVAAVVARGESEFGFQDVSELIHVPGITFVGAIPAELDRHSTYAAVITSNAAQPDAALALIRLLASAEAKPVILESGLKLPEQ
jgi:molybdate transport system substrate-binding protein